MADCGKFGNGPEKRLWKLKRCHTTHIRTSVVSAGRDLVCEKRVFSHRLSLYTLSIRPHTLFLANST